MKPLSFSSLKVLAAIIRNKNKSNFSRPPIDSERPNSIMRSIDEDM